MAGWVAAWVAAWQVLSAGGVYGSAGLHLHDQKTSAFTCYKAAINSHMYNYTDEYVFGCRSSTGLQLFTYVYVSLYATWRMNVQPAPAALDTAVC